MGSTVAPKQFSAPGVLLSPDKQQAVLQQSTRLPDQPLNPGLMMNMSQIPMMSAPNATPSPGMPGQNNNPNAPFNPIAYPMPGGGGLGEPMRPVGGPARGIMPRGGGMRPVGGGPGQLQFFGR